MATNLEILNAMKWKKSAAYCAERLGLSVAEYIIRSTELRKGESASEKDIYIAELEDRLLEFKEDLDKGTATVKGISGSEPKSAEDIEKILKIDRSKWKLSSYWNKQHKDSKGRDYWVVSAMITKKGEKSMSTEDVEDILKTVFKDTKIVVQQAPSKGISNKKALFVYTSDKHIAAYVDNNVSIYHNDYTEGSFRFRMNLIFLEIRHLMSIYGRFEDIYIIDLGDRMDGLNGYTTRGGHKLPQNMSDKEAFETAISVEKEFFDLLFQSDFAVNYSIISNANSNHGGVFDYMVSRALEIYINTAYPFVKTSVQEKFLDHVEYGKHILILTHGKDDADMKSGLPLHINDKTENYLNKYIMHNGLKTEDKYVSVIKGDLHTDSSQTTYNFRYRNVLSIFGGSKWISTNFGPSHPGCSFDVIEKDSHRIYEHKMLFF